MIKILYNFLLKNKMSNKKRKSIIGLTLYAAHYVKHLNINMPAKKAFLP